MSRSMLLWVQEERDAANGETAAAGGDAAAPAAGDGAARTTDALEGSEPQRPSRPLALVAEREGNAADTVDAVDAPTTGGGRDGRCAFAVRAVDIQRAAAAAKSVLRDAGRARARLVDAVGRQAAMQEKALTLRAQLAGAEDACRKLSAQRRVPQDTTRLARGVAGAKDSIASVVGSLRARAIVHASCKSPGGVTEAGAEAAVEVGDGREHRRRCTARDVLRTGALPPRVRGSASAASARKAVAPGSEAEAALDRAERGVRFGLFLVTLMFFRAQYLFRRRAAMQQRTVEEAVRAQVEERRKLDLISRAVGRATRTAAHRRQQLREEKEAAHARQKLLSAIRLERAQNAGALVLQRAYRGHTGRRAAQRLRLKRDGLRAQRALLHACATTIQRVWRGLVGRIAASERRLAAAEAWAGRGGAPLARLRRDAASVAQVARRLKALLRKMLWMLLACRGRRGRLPTAGAAPTAGRGG